MLLTRRAMLTLTASGLAISAVSVNRLSIQAADPPFLNGEPGVFTAQAATTGTPRVPTAIRLKLPNGAFCAADFESYVKGVVPAEMAALWSAEALKAQAVAARTYAASYLGTYGYICTTSTCQNYDPSKRTAASDAAVDATRGQVMAYQGGRIWSYYHSTCGGQTATSPDAASPYCSAVRCWRENDGSGRDPADLTSDTAAAGFWRTTDTPSSFCGSSPSFRWSWTISRSDLESILNTQMAGSAAVSPPYSAGQIGQLKNLSAAIRSTSGKVTKLRVTAASAGWDVNGETAIRSFLRTSLNGDALRSSNVILSLERSGDTFTRLTGQGGGYGHGIGMCQYGAKRMADLGYDYQSILRHYYSSVSVESGSPAVVSVPPSSGRRIFIALSNTLANACE